ncbi:hypothetical protein [Planktothricoides raciborskii]|uniref:Uncharacterized protein n=1 Tax=Planktothricoides raciborskii FACHB-1370 TaxID=2949576 RepID=A0ABR8EE29_9CYAN|nr:hypothetical protein [Planktothricoides raciborskii]MBD2543856.1 hypothetical protein [Planktothricoides raciborskii FACHB-1370]MBD2583137.1 hypothetical protein [Planktothricoides raciborskii FACHB-1261]
MKITVVGGIQARNPVSRFFVGVQKPGFFSGYQSYLWVANKKPGFFVLADRPETGFLFGISQLSLGCKPETRFLSPLSRGF